ncbi:MAG: lysoplasmalogenase family protein [Eubacteriales bacterium]|nr:lysoplasmalogenase family protein [Eubacteriales bacterium]
MVYAIAAAALIWLALMPAHFYFIRKGRKGLVMLFKGLPTLLCAVLAAVFGAEGEEFARLMLVGLAVCLAADEAIEVRLEAGGALFFVGHVLYVAALVTLKRPGVAGALVFAASAAGLNVFLRRYRAKILDRRLYVCLTLYTLALSALLGAAAPLPFEAFSRRTALAAVGAVLFVISDMTLCRNSVENRPEREKYVSLGIYYMAQLCFAVCAFPA